MAIRPKEDSPWYVQLLYDFGPITVAFGVMLWIFISRVDNTATHILNALIAHQETTALHAKDTQYILKSLDSMSTVWFRICVNTAVTAGNSPDNCFNNKIEK